MSARFDAPKGTSDLIGNSARGWEYLSQLAAHIFSLYGYEPIYTPIFESTDLFVRGIGEATDVVGKEMYTFEDKGGRSLTLRPENTASVVRASINHALATNGQSAKLYYAGPMFRYERPQKGRQRQFYQIGAEALGMSDPSTDAEMIIMLMHFFKEAGIKEQSMRLLINSMGDTNCRPAFREKVADYIRANAEDLCQDCARKADTNPLRVFDCKNPICIAVMQGAPRLLNELCDDCEAHFAEVRSLLDDAGLEYEIDTTLVRGLDYYTRTVFEVQVDTGLGSQNAIGGGGRYDGLFESLGGNSTPGIGFANGFERIMLVLAEQGVEIPKAYPPKVYIAASSDDMRAPAFALATELRRAGVSALVDTAGRSLRAQFKNADRGGAPYVLIFADQEFKTSKLVLRNMETKEEQLLTLDEAKEFFLDA